MRVAERSFAELRREERLGEVDTRADTKADAGVRPPTDVALDLHVRAKHFGTRRILADVQLRVAPGEIVCLVGASGCGKSTLLRIAAGLDGAFEGAVRVAGRAHDAPTREVGVVFQEPRLFPWCSVADNIAFEAGGARRDDPRVAALLDDVGLSGYGAALPRQLSGGQAQRVALARALAGQPRVLLLDEPFSAVDAFTRMKLQDLLLGLVRRRGIAALMVTHDIDEAAWLADRVLVLDADPGRLREQITVPVARPRARDDLALAAARAHIFHGLQAAHAL